MAFRVSNPVLTESAFDRASHAAFGTATMTVGGAVAKTAYLCAVAGIAASLTWSMVADGRAQTAVPWMIGGLVVGLVLAS